jgi:hypothetical protein
MHTIWFRLPHTSGALSTVIGGGDHVWSRTPEGRAFALGYARETWDKLEAAGFEMVSQRP